MKFAVGLSGGVDSSVSAARLVREGHEVVGVTMKLWREGRYEGGGCRDACFGPGEEEDIAHAEEFCRKLGIEYRVFDCADDYERLVLSNFRSEYLAGRTPNPCVLCNAGLKFGLLPELAARSGLVFDRFATGHYARVVERDGRWRLLRGVDSTKDQSYFLYRLTQSQLARVHFPLGGLRKSDVRALAAEYGLAVANKPDSQDFYGGKYAELVGRDDEEGEIVDESGHLLGRHNGFWHFTIGQSKGLGIAVGEKVYVVRLEAERNRVVVGRKGANVRHVLTLGHCNWIAEPPAGEYEVKIRSAAIPQPAIASSMGDGGCRLEFPNGVDAPACGQSAVLYRGDEVLGGGIIAEVE